MACLNAGSMLLRINFYTILKFSLNSSCWFYIYSLIILSVITPTLLQKYPLAHKCCPQYLHFKSLYSYNKALELLLFICCTIFEIDKLGGQLINICTWSLLIAPLIIVISIDLQLYLINSLVLSAIFSFNTLYLYFVVQTKWYCKSYCTCDDFLILSPAS